MRREVKLSKEYTSETLAPAGDRQKGIGTHHYIFNLCKHKLYSFKTQISKRSEGNIEEI